MEPTKKDNSPQPTEIDRAQARLLNAREENNSRLSRQQSTIIRLDSLMRSALNYYPGQDLSAETISEYRQALLELMEMHGPEKVERAMSSLRLTSRFFPHPAEVNEKIQQSAAAEADKGRWERQEQYMQEVENLRRREHEKIMAEGGYVSMAEVAKDFYDRRKAKDLNADAIKSMDESA